MSDGLVVKVAADMAVLPSIVGHKLCLTSDVGAKERHNIGGACAINVKTTSHAATLDQRQHGVLVSKSLSCFDANFATNKCFVAFHNFPAAAKRGIAVSAQSKTQAMHHE